jgi:hypothetical protein
MTPPKIISGRKKNLERLWRDDTLYVLLIVAKQHENVKILT